jgi:hypothetical protein
VRANVLRGATAERVGKERIERRSGWQTCRRRRFVHSADEQVTRGLIERRLRTPGPGRVRHLVRPVARQLPRAQQSRLKRETLGNERDELFADRAYGISANTPRSSSMR